MDAELAAVPDEADLRHAHAQTAAAEEAVHRARSRRDEYAATAREAARTEEAAASEPAETAAAVDLPADRKGLAAVRQALADYTAVLTALWPALRERAAAEDRGEAERVGEPVAERPYAPGSRPVLRWRPKSAAPRSSARSAQPSPSCSGGLTETADARDACGRGQRQARTDRTSAEKSAGRTEGRIGQVEKDAREADAARAEAIAAPQRFAATGLLAVVLPEVAVPA